MTGGSSPRTVERSTVRRMMDRPTVMVVDSFPLPGGQPDGCQYFVFAVGARRHRVWGMGVLSPQGLSVNLLGGEISHIGAVAIGIPRPSLARAGRRSATTSVFALVGHKEDDLAKSLANDLARRIGIPTVVVAGVHLRRARSSDIAAVLRNAESALEAIAAHVASARRSTRRR